MNAETLQALQMDALQMSVLAVNADVAQQQLPQKYDRPNGKRYYVKLSHIHRYKSNELWVFERSLHIHTHAFGNATLVKCIIQGLPLSSSSLEQLHRFSMMFNLKGIFIGFIFMVLIFG